ncbi:hypothetical protein POL25_37720 [Nannocystis sp. bb15-2]|uniref:Uncharacterized protein n=1 Tax=Nannocystis bainbridge TaxID=2995303 RepID=A0ABT5EA22_9BACT|nr:hypothetical protein [Nannocystis bainbridge]MDC0722689.1 hypothetical protein [Nannocystis bainbridge]
MAKRHHLDAPPLAVDEEVRQPEEETAPGAEEVRRPGAGESGHGFEGMADGQLEPPHVEGPELRGKSARLFGLSSGVGMETDTFSQLNIARHATESQ